MIFKPHPYYRLYALTTSLVLLGLAAVLLRINYNKSSQTETETPQNTENTTIDENFVTTWTEVESAKLNTLKSQYQTVLTEFTATNNFSQTEKKSSYNSIIVKLTSTYSTISDIFNIAKNANLNTEESENLFIQMKDSVNIAQEKSNLNSLEEAQIKLDQSINNLNEIINSFNLYKTALTGN